MLLRTLGIAVFLAPCFLIAQYSYVGVGYGISEFQYTTEDNDQSATYRSNTMLRQPHLVIQAMSRPMKNWAFGLAVTIPGKQPGLSSVLLFDKDYSYFTPVYSSSKYSPTVFDYEVQPNVGYGLKTRFFFEARSNLYVELNVQYESFTEHIRYERSASPAGMFDDAIGALNLDLTAKHTTVAPGMKLGFMPTITKWVYLDIGIGLKYLRFDNSPLSVTYAYGWDYVAERLAYTTRTSGLTGNRIALDISIAFGRYF